MSSVESLERACRVCGSQIELATRLGISSPSISEWKRRGRVPVERCPDIERATAGQITRHDLRPDVFGEAPPASLREAG